MAGAASGEWTEGQTVFLCSSCRMPLADSGDLVGRTDDDNVILLKAVTENVEIDENKAVSSYQQDAFRLEGNCLVFRKNDLRRLHVKCHSWKKNALRGNEALLPTVVQPNTVRVLRCKGCSSTLGALYVATPLTLDHKRDLFNLNAVAVTCYCSSNSRKQTSRMDQKVVNLPTIPFMEAQLKKPLLALIIPPFWTSGSHTQE
ncbi:protein Mis18-alpha-like isoform X2 [Eleutherodactylus coqui]|uniref:protein Mis18-alpha-like isoform X2 n=1 Tax=Eleutherodactylus coqui TaxID=57060 RepID=UPI00346268FD